MKNREYCILDKEIISVADNKIECKKPENPHDYSYRLKKGIIIRVSKNRRKLEKSIDNSPFEPFLEIPFIGGSHISSVMIPDPEEFINSPNQIEGKLFIGLEDCCSGYVLGYKYSRLIEIYRAPNVFDMIPLSINPRDSYQNLNVHILMVGHGCSRSVCSRSGAFLLREGRDIPIMENLDLNQIVLGNGKDSSSIVLAEGRNRSNADRIIHAPLDDYLKDLGYDPVQVREIASRCKRISGIPGEEDISNKSINL